MAKHDPFLSASDSARLDSWMVDIAADELGSITEGGDDYRVGANRSLVIHRTAVFYDFSAGTGGSGGLNLLQHVRKLDHEQAFDAAREWLADHAGFGRLIPSSDAENAAQAGDDAQRQAFINTLWAEATPAASSTTAMAYLSSRGLAVAADDMAQLRWIDCVRGDEGTMLVASTDNDGALVALQETYITPDGCKSTLSKTARMTHRGPHDWSRRGLVRFGDEENPRLYLTEGTEDALSVRMAVQEPVVATLGVAAIGKAKLPVGVKEVVIVRDGDAAGSSSDDRLWRGVARLMGQGGVNVVVTQRPARVFGKETGLKDVNDVLKAHGVDGVNRLLATASEKPDELNSDVFLDELSRLPNTEYEVARAHAAKKTGMRVGTLDVERSERRKRRASEGAGDDVRPDDLPWPDPVTDIGDVLEAAVTEIGRYLIAEPTLYDAMSLWGCSAHLLQREDLNISIAPRLAFQAPGKDCGKSTALNLLWGLCPRAELYSSVSTSSLFRMIHETHPTLLLDEADNQFNKDGGADLKAILNSGHYRPTAYVARSEADAGGAFHTARFNTFTGIAFAGIGTLPDTLQSRSIVGYLQRAKPSEKRERLRHGRTDSLIECRRKFARWALDLRHLPEVPMTEEFANRLGDNWENLFRVAEAAGGEWPARALTAARAAVAAAPADASEFIAVLDAVWTVFFEKGVTRLHTDALVDAMKVQDEGQWTRANGGKEIDAYYLRTHLSPVIPNTPAMKKARRWSEGKGRTKHGFTEDHLAEAFMRYLNRVPPSKAERAEDIPPSDIPNSSGASDRSDARAKNDTTSDSYDAPDSASDRQTASDAFPDMDGASDGQPTSDAASDAENGEQDQAVNCNASDASDVSDGKEGFRGHMPVGAKRRRAATPSHGPAAPNGGDA